MADFRKLILFLAVVVLLVMPAPAQIQTVQTGTGISYNVGGGVGFDREKAVASGIITSGICLERTQTCIETEIDNVEGKLATTQGGVIQWLAQSGNLRLGAIVQAGVAVVRPVDDPTASTGDFAAVFAGGFVLNYSRPSWKGISLNVPVKLTKIEGNKVAWSSAFLVSKRF